MSGYSRLLFIGFFFIGSSILVHGQAGRTPFSSFGVGDYYGNALAHSQGMAGVGISNPQYMYLNNQNPALLVFNRLTTFEAGYVGDVRTVKNSSTSEKGGGGNLNYLLIGFPIKPGKWTSSFGIMPYTNVNYKLSYPQEIVNTLTTVNVIEEGSGGINQASWSHGVAINRNISVGARANYLFSSIDRTYQNQFSQSLVPSIHTRQNFSDFSFTGALSIRKDSLTRKNHRLNFGLVYDFKANVRTRYYQAIELTSISSATDTLVSNQITSTILPQTLSAGISFGRPDYWTIGIDGTWLDYTQFRDMNGNRNGGTTGWKVAIGGEVVPDPTSLSGYLKRVTYRAGASLENYPYLVNGNNLRDFGINFGLSLPVARYSSLDIGLKMGKRGDITANTVVENYFKIYFGVTFNDQWFIKRKFD
jgi:hypothetical protein